MLVQVTTGFCETLVAVEPLEKVQLYVAPLSVGAKVTGKFLVPVEGPKVDTGEGVTEIVILFEVDGELVTQDKLEVTMQVTASLFERVVLENVALSAPFTFIPLTSHR